MSKKINISQITLPSDFHDVSDIYLFPENVHGTIFYPGAVSMMKKMAYYDFIEYIVEIVNKKTKPVYSLRFVHEGKDILFRAQVFQSVEGKVVVLRRLPSIIPDIFKSTLPKNLIDVLTDESLKKGGLVIIAGETGQGKSTTAASIISHRLKKFGSFCLTIEDPVELPLQGFYVNDQNPAQRGVCFQYDVEDLDISVAIKDSLRCYPSMSNSILFLGETRDSSTASEVLKIANNGHLVITTMHSDDVKGTLTRFVNLASSVPGANANDIRLTFSSVFKLLIHQQIEINPLTKQRKIKPQILYSPTSSSRVANRIRDNGVEMLSTEIDMQNAALLRGEKIEG